MGRGETGVAAALRRHGVVPVIVIDDPERSGPLAAALAAGGLPVAEITFRTAAAADTLRRLSAEHPDMIIGAGTVLSPARATEATAAGARFIVSPGFNPRVVDRCLELDTPVFPGVCTPTELEAALDKGVRIVKFFPAEPMGGLAYLKAMAAPYRDVEFIPTGGITLESLPGYLGYDKVVACGGSWVAPSAWIAAGDYDRIRDEARRAVAVVESAREGRA